MPDKPRTVLVVLGGLSAEREVSHETGTACARALEQRGYEVRLFDWREGCSVSLLQALTPRPDVVFNALHGTYGEDGCLAGLLACCHIPSTHSGVLASALAMDKLMTKNILQPLGIRFAESRPLEEVWQGETLSFPLPCVVKPVAQGSSIGVERLLNADARFSGERLFPLMVEHYIEGREFTVGIFREKAMGVTEVVARGAGFYDYKAKYEEAHAAHHIFPAQIEAELAETLCRWSELAHKTLGCRTTSRCDFRYDGKHLYMLEINTHPGMTAMSLVPEQARGSGISFEELTETLVLEACKHAAEERTPPAVLPSVPPSVPPSARKNLRKSMRKSLSSVAEREQIS